MTNPSREHSGGRSQPQRNESDRNRQQGWSGDEDFGYSTDGIGDYGGYGGHTGGGDESSQDRGGYFGSEGRQDSTRGGAGRYENQRYGSGASGGHQGRESGQTDRGPGARMGGGYGSSQGYGQGYGNDLGPQRHASNQSAQGTHRGKGPKGYERSDTRLKEVICEQLSDASSIDASDITVNVSSGVVKLTGTVESRQEKYHVEELVERCGGVKDIDNQLRTQSWQSKQGQSNQGQSRQGSSSTMGGEAGDGAAKGDGAARSSSAARDGDSSASARK